MGRKKIQIKPITDEKVRKVTFNRRRNGILKKAYELSILCDTQVVVLMYDKKRMCHVYSSEEGANSSEELMQKYIKKDFCTIDPIRNYNTSPDLQIDDPSQAVWRIAREEVAVVNTYTVIPNAGTPAMPSSGNQDDEDDDEADGSEQLSVKSSRTYHTKHGTAKFGAGGETPAMSSKARSPMHRSISPDLQYGQLSPRRSPKQTEHLLPPQQHMYPMQQGLGISGSGYTPVLRPGEHFTPILYPAQQQHSTAYMWPSPDMMTTTDAYGMTVMQPQYQRSSVLTNPAIQYTNRQLQAQVQVYDTPQTQFAPSPMLNPPVLRKSPRKEQAHFNHYVYPPPQRSRAGSAKPQYQMQVPRVEVEDVASPQYIYEDPSQSPPLASSPRKTSGKPAALSSEPRVIPQPMAGTRSVSGSSTGSCLETTNLAPPAERRVTRSQSRSPQLKARQLPPPAPGTLSPMKAQIPLHLRGPSLIDEIIFDPETGAPMVESGALANWFGSTASPGHSRETSHVRGESVSQWLNMPPISE